jgi:hypothetical protein
VSEAFSIRRLLPGLDESLPVEERLRSLKTQIDNLQSSLDDDREMFTRRLDAAASSA